MQHSNNFEELGGVKKGSCMALCVHICAREKERKEKEKNTEADRNEIRQPEQRTQTMCHHVQ